MHRNVLRRALKKEKVFSRIGRKANCKKSQIIQQTEFIAGKQCLRVGKLELQRPKNKGIFADHLYVRHPVRKLMNNVTDRPCTVFSLVIQENQLDIFKEKDN